MPVVIGARGICKYYFGYRINRLKKVKIKGRVTKSGEQQWSYFTCYPGNTNNTSAKNTSNTCRQKNFHRGAEIGCSQCQGSLLQCSRNKDQCFFRIFYNGWQHHNC